MSFPQPSTLIYVLAGTPGSGFGTMYGNKMVKKRIEIKLGF